MYLPMEEIHQLALCGPILTGDLQGLTVHFDCRPIVALNQIDLNNAIIEKDRTTAQKYHHARNLEQFLQDESSFSQ